MRKLLLASVAFAMLAAPAAAVNLASSSLPVTATVNAAGAPCTFTSSQLSFGAFSAQTTLTSLTASTSLSITCPVAQGGTAGVNLTITAANSPAFTLTQVLPAGTGTLPYVLCTANVTSGTSNACPTGKAITSGTAFAVGTAANTFFNQNIFAGITNVIPTSAAAGTYGDTLNYLWSV